MLIESNKKLFKLTIINPKPAEDLFVLQPERMDEMENCFFESNDDKTAFLFDTGSDLLPCVEEYMDKNGMKVTIEDITSKVLLDIEKDEKVNEVFINSITPFGNPLERLTSWKKANLDVDDILDKISKYGIESLNVIDSEILKGE